ncbi:MAG: 4'-phosphopantetheinyl transferase superfamily protein [Xanthomonadales bacterium]
MVLPLLNNGPREKHLAMVEINAHDGLVRSEAFSACRLPMRELDQPRPGEAHIWYLHLGKLGMSLRHALGGEAGRPGQQRPTLGQLKFARRFYLKLLLGAYLGIPGKSVKINRGKRGKPSLDESEHHSDLHFSMAKSEDRILIGFSCTAMLGVDLESVERRAHDPLGVARRYFSTAEARDLELTSPDRLDEAFLRTWACKESVVKASGQGIANQFCRFTVETNPDQLPVVLEFEQQDPAQWSLAMLRPDDGFMGAVALHRRRMEVCAFTLVAE